MVPQKQEQTTKKKFFSFMRVKQFDGEEMKGNSLLDSSFFYPTVFIYQNALVRHPESLKPDYKKGYGGTVLRFKKFGVCQAMIGWI
jgi:hypothetical protein